MSQVQRVEPEALRVAAGGFLKVISSPAEMETYRHDIGDVPPLMTRTLFDTLPDLVVQPASTEQIGQVLAWASRTGMPVIARGAASWGFGGVIPTRGGIVLDLSPFRRVLELDTVSRTVTVQAGARWSDIDIVAKREGLCLMTYPSSKFSTVGGWIATGGWGINSFRYGHISKQIVSMSVALASGEIRRVTPADADFDTFVSTEGEFGVIAEVTLRLRQIPESSFPHMLHFADDAAAFDFVGRLVAETKAGRFSPNVVRFLDRNHIRDTNEILHAEIFKESPSLLVEFGQSEDDERFGRFLATSGCIEEAPDWASSYLWNERLFGMKTKRLGPTILASEVIIPIPRAASFIAAAKRLGARFGVEICVDSYILDAERALVMTTFLCDSRTLRYYVNLPLVSMLTELAVTRGAAPYGLGIWNAPFIRRLHTAEKIASLQKAKAALDPGGILNPGKYFRVGSKWAGIPALVFRPWLFEPAMRVMAFGSPLMGRLFTLLLGRDRKCDELDAELSTHACAKCGNCIAVCPAYLVTGNEAVTAKGKLALARRLVEGREVTREEARSAFFCMHCKACQEICQTNLEHMSMWEALEKRLAGMYGLPEQEIREFLKAVDASREYWEMVERNALNH